MDEPGCSVCVEREPSPSQRCFAPGKAESWLLDPKLGLKSGSDSFNPGFSKLSVPSAGAVCSAGVSSLSQVLHPKTGLAPQGRQERSLALSLA